MTVSIKFKANIHRNGFTLIEVVFVTFVMAIIGGSVLLNLKSGDQSRQLRQETDNVQSLLRLMQNNSLSGVYYNAAAKKTARSFGFRISTAAASFYETFKERSDASASMSPPYDYLMIEKFLLNRSIAANNLVVGGQPVSSLYVKFFLPHGEIKMTGGSYTEAKNIIASFNLIYSGTAKKKTVTIDGITGRISVQ